VGQERGIYPALEIGQFAGLKARDVTAWGEAQGARPQVTMPKQSSLPCKGGTLGGNGCFVPAFQASGINVRSVSWASARDARSSPGCHIVGFQPTGPRFAMVTRFTRRAENVQTPARDLSRRNTGTATRRFEIWRFLRFPSFLRTEVRAPFARATTAL